MTIHPRGFIRTTLAGSTTLPLIQSRPTASPDVQPCLNVADVAAHYRLGESTVASLLRTGHLSGVRIGRRWRMS